MASVTISVPISQFQALCRPALVGFTLSACSVPGQPQGQGRERQSFRAGRELRDRLAQPLSLHDGETESWSHSQDCTAVLDRDAGPSLLLPLSRTQPPSPAPSLFWPENGRTAFRPFLGHGGGSRGIGLLEPVGSMSSKVLEVEPGSLEARSLSAPHPSTLWVPRVLCHRGPMENTYHAYSFSAPPLARAHRGSPGRCCVSSRTTPAAPGREGSSAREEGRGQGSSRQGWGRG